MPIFDWNENDDTRRQARRTLDFVLRRFESLLSAADGESLEDPCSPEALPALAPLSTELADEYDLTVEGYTAGCAGHTRFVLPYAKEDNSEGKVIACAVCDGGLSWPRLQPPPAHA